MNEQNIKVFNYFCKAIRAAVGVDAIPEKPSDVAWNSVFSLAKHHSLISLLYSVLKDALKLDGEEKLIEYLDKQYSIEYARNMTQSAEFKAITELFTREKLPFLPIKGFLMKALYPKPELRNMADMDIFVGEENAARARELLSGIGYSTESDPDAVYVHDVMIKRPFVDVELHRILEMNSDFGFKDCVARPDNPYWYTMTTDDFLTFMISHTYKHYVNGGCGIRAVLDLYLYRKKNPDHLESAGFIKKLKSRKLYDFYLTFLSVVDKWFDGKEDITEVSEFEIYTITGGTYGTLSNVVDRNLEKKSKLSYIFSRLFPRPKVIKMRYRWVRKCIILLPIGYIVRIVQSMFNGRFMGHARAISKSKSKNKSNTK